MSGQGPIGLLYHVATAMKDVYNSIFRGMHSKRSYSFTVCMLKRDKCRIQNCRSIDSAQCSNTSSTEYYRGHTA
jgi:hypothetical protein